MVGVVLMVGAGIKFSIMISAISGGSLFFTIILVALASLVLGMGLPVTASYIVLAVLAAPSMEMLGTSLIAAHLLIFWYSQDANVTPPGLPGGLFGCGNLRQQAAGNRYGVMEISQRALSDPLVVRLYAHLVRRTLMAGRRNHGDGIAGAVLHGSVF